MKKNINQIKSHLKEMIYQTSFIEKKVTKK